MKEVDTNQFSSDAPTALEAHLAVTRQLGLEESTYPTAARHEGSSNTKNNQDAEDSLDDGSSSRVGHHGEDDQSPFQAPKVDEQLVPLQEEVGPEQPTPQAKATGSNSRFKNAGIIQEEGDYVDSPKHQARKEVLRTFSSFKCSPSWNTVNT